MCAEPLEQLIDACGSGALVIHVDDVFPGTIADEERAELARLAGRYAVVACISGLQFDELARLVGVPGVALVAERGRLLDPDVTVWSDRLDAFARGVDWPGTRAGLTLSFRFRREDDEAAARVYLERVAGWARVADLVPDWGRQVLHVRPPLPHEPATLTVARRAGVSRCVLITAAETELEGLHRAVEQGGLAAGAGILIGPVATSATGSHEPHPVADLVVDSRVGLLELLRRL